MKGTLLEGLTKLLNDSEDMKKILLRFDQMDKRFDTIDKNLNDLNDKLDKILKHINAPV